MPLIFIHGVNTRIDESYHEARLDRTRLIEAFLRPKLPKPFESMKVVDVYWGDDGAPAGSSFLVPSATGGAAATLGAGQHRAEDLGETVDALLEAWASNQLDDADVRDDLV